MPTGKEVAHESAVLCYLIDVKFKSGYWMTVLDYKSFLLMTFNSSFRRYMFLQLSIGFLCKHDVFKFRMDQILEEVKADMSIADNITDHGQTEKRA